jgi:hypothetical protein
VPLITCPDCSKEISDLAPACPNCGRPAALPAVADDREKQKKREAAKRYNTVSWLLFALAVLALFAGLWQFAALVFTIALILSIIYLVKR